MDILLLILELFLSLIVLFAVGKMVGHIFKLDEYLRKDSNSSHKEMDTE